MSRDIGNSSMVSSVKLDITCRTGWPRSGKYFRKIDLVQYHLSSHVVVRARLQSRDSGATLRWDCEAFDSPFPSITSAQRTDLAENGRTDLRHARKMESNYLDASRSGSASR